MPGDGSEPPAEPDQPAPVRNLIVDELGERLERFRLLGNADEDLAEQVLAGVDVRNERERELWRSSRRASRSRTRSASRRPTGW